MTGAGQGIDEAMALALAEAGETVALLAREEAKAAEVANRIQANGGRAELLEADVRDEAAVCRARETYESALGGRLDILINNAGINLRKPITEFTLAEWNRVIETNLTGTFLMCRATPPSTCSRISADRF